MPVNLDNDSNSRLGTLQSRVSWDKQYTIQFNPDYKAQPPLTPSARAARFPAAAFRRRRRGGGRP